MIPALILARGGSKRIPGKNLKTIEGKSLVGRAIEQAKRIEAIGPVVVSTDSEAIALECWGRGAVLIKRPTPLATDGALSADAAVHALTEIRAGGWFVLLQPTSPCRTTEDITDTIDAALASGRPAYTTYDGKPNGAVYVAPLDLVMALGTFNLPNAIQIEMPQERSIDIDTFQDLDNARSYFETQKEDSHASRCLVPSH